MRIYSEETDFGTLDVDRRVAEAFCGRVIDEFEGKVLVSDPKGRLRRGADRNPEEETDFLRARLTGGKLNVQLFLIFRFGASPRALAENLAARLREAAPETLGVEMGIVKLVFVGTLSEKVSRRKIVFVDDGIELREVDTSSAGAE